MLRILIADDSSLMRKRVSDVASTVPDAEVIGVADNGIDALKMVWTYEPDLIILDLQMPGKNGIEVLREINKHRNHKQVCILTKHNQQQYKRVCQDLGAAWFLSKAKDFSRLKHIFSDMARKHQTGSSNNNQG